MCIGFKAIFVERHLVAPFAVHTTDQGPSYKQQAASFKLQASSLTRKNYRIIKDYAKKEKNKTKTNN